MFLFTICTYIQELESCQAELTAKAEEVKAVKKENRKRRKIIESYQDMLSHGANGLHSVRKEGGRERKEEGGREGGREGERERDRGEE